MPDCRPVAVARTPGSPPAASVVKTPRAGRRGQAGRVAAAAGLLAALGTGAPAAAEMADFVAALARAETQDRPVWTADASGCPAMARVIAGVSGARVRLAPDEDAGASTGSGLVQTLALTRTGFLLERAGLAAGAPRPRFVLREADAAAGVFAFALDAICPPDALGDGGADCTLVEDAAAATSIIAFSDPCTPGAG